jgi:hypothetical protein
LPKPGQSGATAAKDKDNCDGDHDIAIAIISHVKNPPKIYGWTRLTKFCVKSNA